MFFEVCSSKWVDVKSVKTGHSHIVYCIFLQLCKKPSNQPRSPENQQQLLFDIRWQTEDNIPCCSHPLYSFFTFSFLLYIERTIICDLFCNTQYDVLWFLLKLQMHFYAFQNESIKNDVLTLTLT